MMLYGFMTLTKCSNCCFGFDAFPGLNATTDPADVLWMSDDPGLSVNASLVNAAATKYALCKFKLSCWFSMFNILFGPPSFRHFRRMSSVPVRPGHALHPAPSSVSLRDAVPTVECSHPCEKTTHPWKLATSKSW